MAELTQQEKKVVAAFQNVQQALFPSGEIPSMNEIRSRIEAGTQTVSDSFIADMYNKGVPDEPLLSELDQTKDFYAKFEKTFSREVSGPAPNTQGISGKINSLSSKVDLNSSFTELEAFSKQDASGITESFRRTNIDPLVTANQNVLNRKLSRTGAAKGTRKLAKGAIPAEVLQSVLQGIGDIPDPVTRDAVMASLLGYRGEDLSGMRTSRALAVRSKPVRPFYDREAGISRDPEVATGGGRKAKGPDKPAGPVLREILNRRFDSAGPTGELFPGMTTGKISSALKKHVFPKIPKEVQDKLLTKPSGYTDLRRITASAIANQLGRPDLASEIISHKGGGDDLLDKVMTGYYTDVEDIGGLQQRGEILVAYEKMMADAVGATDAKGLGEALRLDLSPEFNAQYPETETLARPTGSTVDVTPATPKQIAQGEELRAQKTREATAASFAAEQSSLEDAEARLLKRASQAPEIVEAERKLAEAKAGSKKAAQVASGESFLQKALKMAKKIPGPVKRVIPFAGTIPALYNVPIVQEGLASQMEDIGIPRSIADPVAYAGAGADFLIGEVAQVAPSDVIEVGRSMASPVADPGSARPIERVMADQPELFNQSNQPQITKPVKIPDPVPTRQGMLSAGGAKQRVNQARSAALAGEETSMSGSFLN